MAKFQEQIFGKKLLDQFGNDYVNTLTKELLRYNKKASGNLINSLDYRVVREAKKIQLIIQANDYLKYVDKGVSGTERKFSGTPYKYTTKMPPLSALSKWASLKGIPQNNVYAVQRSIFKFGIKPTNVIQKTNKIMAEKVINKFSKIIANDVEKYVSFELFKVNENKPTITKL